MKPIDLETRRGMYPEFILRIYKCVIMNLHFSAEIYTRIRLGFKMAQFEEEGHDETIDRINRAITILEQTLRLSTREVE